MKIRVIASGEVLVLYVLIFVLLQKFQGLLYNVCGLKELKSRATNIILRGARIVAT